MILRVARDVRIALVTARLAVDINILSVRTCVEEALDDDRAYLELVLILIIGCRVITSTQKYMFIKTLHITII